MNRTLSTSLVAAVILLAVAVVYLLLQVSSLGRSDQHFDQRLKDVGGKEEESPDEARQNRDIRDLKGKMVSLERDLASRTSDREETREEIRAVLEEFRPALGQGPRRWPVVAPAPAVPAGPVLGIFQRALTAEEAERMKIPPGGSVVQGLVENGPAAAAGFLEGDVIVEAEGQRIANDEDMRRFLRGRRPGERITIRYYRGAEKKEAQAVLAAAQNLQPLRTPHADTMLLGVLREVGAAPPAAAAVLQAFAEESRARTPGLKPVIRKIGGEVAENLDDKASLSYRDLSLLTEKAALLGAEERSALLRGLFEIERRILQALPADQQKKYEEAALYRRVAAEGEKPK